MQRFIKAIGTAVVLTAFASSAHASAVFSWVDITGNANGSITLTDDAYAAGHATFNILEGGSPGPVLAEWEASGILAASWAGGGAANVGMSRPTLATFFPCGACRLIGDLTLSDDGSRLIGNLEITNDNNNLTMSSNLDGTLWVTGINETENPFGTCRGSDSDPDSCNMAGYWSLTQAPAPQSSGVPEPTSAALLLAGIGTVFARRRRRA